MLAGERRPLPARASLRGVNLNFIWLASSLRGAQQNRDVAMKRLFLGTATALMISAATFAVSSANAQSDQSRTERMQNWAADHETLLGAKLAGMKAELALTADQEKLWSSFESAVKDAAKARMDAMQAMMRPREDSERLSPVDRLQAMADHMAQAAADLRKIADAAKPLYASLDDPQKHKFGMLGRMLMPERAQFAMEMMRHHHMEDGAQ
jgi:hypothetical protein